MTCILWPSVSIPVCYTLLPIVACSPEYLGYPNSEFLRERSDFHPTGVAEHISYPHAFLRVKEFLKNLLKALLLQHASHTSECRCHSILKTQSDLEIANALRLQLEAFWLGEPPFHAPVLDDDIMEWWMNLERGNSPRSNVIAVSHLFHSYP
jgi:hypothetical protein